MADVVEGAPRSRWSKIAASILPRLVFYPFLAVSLLVFPSMLPWMILGWLLLFGVRRFRGKPAWPVLALCLGILLVKRVDWPPGMIAFGLAMIATGVLEFIRKKRSAWNRAALAAAGCLAVAWAAMSWNWTLVGRTTRRPPLVEGRPVVCLGDSLTVGGFPRILEKRLRVPVIDLAQGGITTVEGLRSFPEVLAAKPQAVVIELGGHDSIRGKSRKETKGNLDAMIKAAREAGAEVILFEVPRGFVTDPYAGLERELSREHDLELVTDGAIRQLVLFSPFTPLGSWTGRQLSYDGLHPNDAGNAFLADRVEGALRRVYGDRIK